MSEKIIGFDLLLLSMQLIAYFAYVLFGKQKKSYQYLSQQTKQIRHYVSLKKNDRYKEKKET